MTGRATTNHYETRLWSFDAERLDFPAAIGLARRADAVRPLGLVTLRTDVHPRRREAMLRAPLVPARFRGLLLRDGHQRLRSIEKLVLGLVVAAVGTVLLGRVRTEQAKDAGSARIG
jgi:hypothetical protein